MNENLYELISFLKAVLEMCPVDKLNTDYIHPKIINISFDIRSESVYKIQLEIANDTFSFVGNDQSELFSSIVSWINLDVEEREYLKEVVHERGVSYNRQS